MAWKRFGHGLAWWLLPLACTFPEGPTKQGELGDGHFRYLCVGNADPLCDRGSTASVFPDAIAVGGRFSLEYAPKSGGPLPVVEPASRPALTKEGEVFTLHAPGYVAVFAQNAFGDVLDVLHLNGYRVSDMTISRNGTEQSMLRLSVGEQVDVTAEPRNAVQTLLAGSLHYAWSSSDPSVFIVAAETSDDDVTLEAVGPGVATLHVEAGDYEKTISVEVTADGTSTTGESESDSESESGSGDSTEDGGTSGDETTGTTGGDTEEN